MTKKATPLSKRVEQNSLFPLSRWLTEAEESVMYGEKIEDETPDFV